MRKLGRTRVRIGGWELETTGELDWIAKYTGRCVKKKRKEKETGSGELSPLIYIIPSSCQDTKQ
jgi:hypothetical protein